MQTLQIENENLPLILINKERDWNDYYYYVFIILNESMSKTDIHVGDSWCVRDFQQRMNYYCINAGFVSYHAQFHTFGEKKSEQRLQQQMTLDFVATDFSLGTQKKPSVYLEKWRMDASLTTSKVTHSICLMQT